MQASFYIIVRNGFSMSFSIRAHSTFAPIPRMRCSFNRWQPHLHTLPIHGQFSVASHWLSWALIRKFSHNGLRYECGEIAYVCGQSSWYQTRYSSGLQKPIFCEYLFTTGKLRFSPFLSVFSLFGKLSISKLFTYEVESCTTGFSKVSVCMYAYG